MKLTQFTNPLSGNKGKITDIGGLWENILGVFVLLFVFAMGQNLANQVTKRVPAIDTRLEPIVNQPTVSGEKVTVI